MNTVAPRLAHALSLALALVLAGCASTPSGQAPATSQPSSTSASPRIAAAVNVPAAARRTVVLALTGPKTVVESKDWKDFKSEWQSTFTDYAKQGGVNFRFADDAKPTGEDGTLLRVEVADYRMVGIGARIFLGAMTGNAYIDAKVRFSNLRNGSPFGEQQYNTSSSAWGGVFAKVTPQQIDSIARNIFIDLGVSLK